MTGEECKAGERCYSDYCSISMCWHTFLHENIPKITGYLYTILGNREDAEDCVQQAAVEFFRHIDQFDPTRPLFPFFIRIARNVAYNRGRRRRPLVSFDLIGDIEDSTQLTDDPMLQDLALDRAVEWVIENAELNEEQAELFVLLVVDTLKPSEIAEFLDETPKNVRNKLWRLRKKIQARVRRQDVTNLFDSP